MNSKDRIADAEAELSKLEAEYERQVSNGEDILGCTIGDILDDIARVKARIEIIKIWEKYER